MPKLTETTKDKMTNGNSQAVPLLPVQVSYQLPSPAPEKVALIGTAPSSRMLAPFNDPAWTIWCCSPGNMNVIPRVDLWFELHGNLLWPECVSYGAPYIEWLKVQKFPIFMQDQSFVPNAITFPWEVLVEKFGRNFFTSTFAWMMAYGIHLGVKEMALYGIDMASRDEYILQRPGFYFFKYVAEQFGIKVSAPNESDIMQPPGLYGYSDVKPFGRKLAARRSELRQRRTMLRQEIDERSRSLYYLDGADEDVDYMQSIWSGVADEIDALRMENTKLKHLLQTQGQQVGQDAVAPPVVPLAQLKEVADGQLCSP